MALPIFLLLRQYLRPGGLIAHSNGISPYAAGLALILAFNMIDLLPNATLTPLTWLIAGALLGYAEMHAAQSRKDLDSLEETDNLGPQKPRTIL